MTLVCAGRYDDPVLSISVPDRRVLLADVRNAASAIYGAAVRTPLVRLELSDVSGGNIDLSRFASLVGACDNPGRAGSA